MQYVSTRATAPALGFKDAMLTGLARDGGLYVPENWPQFSRSEIADMAGKPYAEIARTVISPFVAGEIDDASLTAMINEAYASFHHDAVVPLNQVGPDHFLMELFHGPTLAFKDVALQLLARLMDHVLAERGQRATVVCATSGDTGGSAIEGFRGKENIDIFVLFPKGKVSPVQQKQMTTVGDKNVHAIAIEGDFDDCQSLVKQMFNHHAFRDRQNLSGVNSINWARIMAQVVYYFSSATSIGSPSRKVSFTVPTGNFGDIFAGYVAKRCGLPIDELVIATNSNDILVRTLNSGRYKVTGTLTTSSPSMDIQVSSNFERLLYEALGREGEEVTRAMSSLAQSGAFTVADNAMQMIRNDFSAGSASEEECANEIARMLENCGYVADPHTAVALKVAREHMKAGTPMITLSTAHPAKFPDAVEKAINQRPQLPAWQGNLMEREERFITLANDLGEVERTIEEKTGV